MTVVPVSPLGVELSPNGLFHQSEVKTKFVSYLKEKSDNYVVFFFLFSVYIVMPNALYPSIDKFCRNCKGFNLVFDFVSRAASLFGPAVFLKSYIIAVVNAMHLKPGNFYTKYCSFRFINLCFFLVLVPTGQLRNLNT